jgi:hypothetical protein
MTSFHSPTLNTTLKMFVLRMIDAPNHALRNITADTLIELLPQLRKLEIPYSKETLKAQLKKRLTVQSFIDCANILGHADGRYFEHFVVAQVLVTTLFPIN